MVGTPGGSETVLESDQRDASGWRHVIPALGVLLLIAAAGKSISELAGDGLFLEAVLDFALISFPGIVMLYIGRWLPHSGIEPEFYRRIVLWILGSVAVMAIVLGLRVLHPGVTVQFTFGTQAVLLSIGSLAGLGIGVHEARALTNAKTLAEQNETLQRTERRLEEAVAELEDSNERLEQFAYAASHDLQEPLRMVTSYLQLIETRYADELDADGEEFIEFAVDGADRMHAMIDGLLEYSRVETGGDPFEPTDLDAVLDDVLTDLQFKIDDADAEITRESLPTVDCDERQLHQLFQNLVSNAIDYSGDGSPRVHVSAVREGDEWTISVRDDGTGIDADDTDRVFEIFQRGHSSGEQAGSGIGLALCKRIVERHDGAIWVDSERDVGSTFRFTLPPGADPVDAPDAAAQCA
ncbi:sensor histidine kinase [Natrinema sp. LN54]|uniref:sensor histidine kinase n=1 Tax=Natrinema sp. LN54 TaxID=3458705 RepID=UPI004035F3D3